MKPIKTFEIGSKVFFKEYPDYIIKDNDELCIMDSFEFETNVMNAKFPDNKDVFFYRNMDKYGFIMDALNSGFPMRIGKFLVPEFANYLQMNIDDLKYLEPLILDIDDKHKYEKIIFDSYIKNDSFTLTKEQRDEAYIIYKKYRKN